MTSERVDAGGVSNIAAAAASFLAPAQEVVKEVLAMNSEEDLQVKLYSDPWARVWARVFRV